MTAPTTTSTTEAGQEAARFELSRAALTDALATVALAVPSRAAAVPGGILLESGTARCLNVRAFNGETAVSVRIPDAAIGPGRLLLNHDDCTKTVNALVKGLPKREADRLPVTIAGEAGDAPTVELADATMPLQDYPVQQYPELPEMPATVARMDRTRFAAEAARVLCTVDDRDVWPQAAGVQFEAVPTGLVLAATDRYRLGVAHVPAQSEIAAKDCTTRGALVPGDPLARVLKRFSGPTVEIGIGPRSASPRVVSLTCGDVSVLVRCIDADFPDYHRILPTCATRTVTVDRDDALHHVKRAAAVLAAKGDRNQPVALEVDGDAVRLSPAVSERRAQVTTPAISAQVTGTGGPARIHFKPEFLREALETVTGLAVTLHTQDTATGSVLFTEEHADLSDPLAFRHLLKPIRMDD